jgi:hypothetical protein
MEHLTCLTLSHRTVSVDSIEELAVFAVLHEDVDFALVLDHFIDLGDVFMHQSPLMLHFLNDGLGKVRMLLNRAYLNGHSLSSKSMHCLPHCSKSPNP